MSNANDETTVLLPYTQNHIDENHDHHDHDYDQDHHDHRNEEDELESLRRDRKVKEIRVLVSSCLLTAFFFFVELVGGYFAGSLAVMSDAAHLASDMAGLLISLLAVTLSKIPASEIMSFGYSRAEVLGTFVSLSFIWTLTILLVIAAIGRLVHPTPVNGRLMLVLGAIGLAVNIALGVVLGHGSHSHSHGLHNHSHNAHEHDHSHERHGHNHTHEHDHSHEHRGHNHTHEHDHSHEHHGHNHSHEHLDEESGQLQRSWFDIITGAGIESMTVRAAYLHVLGDAVQSIGVIIAAAIIMVKPNWTIVDPLCTLLFACIVLLTTKDLAGQALCVLMEGTPPGVSLRAVHDRLYSISGVSRVADLHIWSLSLKRPALCVHLYCDTETLDYSVVKEAQDILVTEFSIEHSTIQINSMDEFTEHDQCLSSSELRIPSLPVS